MRLFILRRSETRPIGPLSPADVVAMRLRWELSDADYYRSEDTDAWKLLGELPLPARRPHRLFPLALGAVAALVLALLAALHGHHRPLPRISGGAPLAASSGADESNERSSAPPPPPFPRKNSPCPPEEPSASVEASI